MDAVDLVTLLLVGAGAGFLSTLFGIGGGLVMVPLLHYGAGVPFADATALSLLAMAFQVPGGVYQHARRGAVDWRLGALLAGGGTLGVVAGIQLQPRIPVPWLKLLFALLMLLAAYRMVQPAPRPRLEGHHPVLVAGLGVVAGTASRLLGIGGGLVTVPTLALMGIPIHVAVGSSLVAVFTNAALASSVNLAAGIGWQPAVPLTVGALLLSPLGARAAHGLADSGLRKAFAVALALAALYVGTTSGVA